MARRANDEWRRTSGSLNKRTFRAALFDAAARSADSFSSVTGRWSLSRRRRSRTASEHKARLRKRRSFHQNPPVSVFDDGSPSLHTDTPFVIATTADHQRNPASPTQPPHNQHTAPQNHAQTPAAPLIAAVVNSPATRTPAARFGSFGSEPSSFGVRAAEGGRFVHPALRPTFDALRLLRKIPEVMAGWLHVRAAGRLRRWPNWTLFWAELRGGYLLLTREANSVLAVANNPAAAYPIDYIFGATHCDLQTSVGRSGSVRLRLRRKGRRATTTSRGNTNPQNPNDLEATMGARRMSERSTSKSSSVQTDKRRFGATLASLAAKMIRRSQGTPTTNASAPLDSATDFSTTILDVGDSDLVLKIPSAPEAEKWEWALRNATSGYESKPLGDFQLIDALGAGAFGRVYLVYDTVKGEYLALKVLDKSLVFRDRLHFESAVNERLTLELVKGQPFMAQLRYAFQTRSCLYLVTDFYEGGDLFSFLRSHHNDVRESQAIRIIAEVVMALHSMHEMGIVYRDLKPENVLLDRNGHVRLADLGLAKLLDRDNDYLTSTICGSLSYAAPEMLSEKQYGIAFDMWTLGVFIYQVLTGDMPFETEDRNRQEILEDQRKAEIPVNGLSDEGYALVCALLRPNPLRRPTCQELRQYPIFEGVNWDDLVNKLPHRNSVQDVMEKIANKARQDEENKQAETTELDDAGQPEQQQQQQQQQPPHHIGGQSDVFLLRNFDPEEWSDMSFSDVSDGASTASFFRPDFGIVDELPALTRMVPGWSLTSDNVVPLVKPQLAVSPLSGRKGNARNSRRPR